MDLQRLRKSRRVDQALGEEQKRKAGVDGCRFGRDGSCKGIRVGLIRGERRKARCIACARTGQLPSSAISSNAVLCVSFSCACQARFASKASLPSIPVLAMGPVAALHIAFAMIESTMEPALAALFCPLYATRITHCRSTSAAFGNDQG
ncbi:hypothetical protein [Mesorhizobium sp. B4-1-1]|uniref:hypothetical protein n=1 Tax=Mesorhizobium sp. B4-1-1 TaxID=2589890 RepID=UPI001FEFE612|nr:hypothetical protein [Mesorhizobium sp. B4-1-1]